jgi:NitT/TauT family transport system substrate-binding protein
MWKLITTWFCCLVRVLMLAAGLTLFGVTTASAADKPLVKAGVLKFGTVNWLLDTVQHHGLDAKHGYKLEQLELARRDATSVALLAGEVDTIVADWFWALRERSAGEPFVFHPYSRTLGALIVGPDGGIASLNDLAGKKVGVAGGPLDKSWLLMRAWGEKQGIGDIARLAQPVFGAPPLLAEKMRSGELDAVLIYWHYAAKLEGAGFKQLFGVDDAMRGLGMKSPPPLIGFLFRKPATDDEAVKWQGFRRSLDEASALLLTSDEEWQRLRPRMGVKSDAEFAKLRDRFRAGRLQNWDPANTGDAKALFELLKSSGGEKVTGRGVTFDAGVFATGAAQ